MTEVDHESRFSLRLKNLRREKNMSQEQLAFKAELHPTFVNELEKRKKQPSLNTICKLAKALDVNPSAFFLTKTEYEKIQTLLS